MLMPAPTSSRRRVVALQLWRQPEPAIQPILSMPFVVTDSCIQCKYTDCVEVCPMACFRQGPNFLVIVRDDCIDCSLCAPVCPVGAIYNEIDLPAEQRHFIDINARLASHPDWQAITRSQAPLADHESWNKVANKLEFLKLA